MGGYRGPRMDDGIEVGTTIADRYVVEGMIGAGGIAEVYKVRHLELGSSHALKVLTWRRKGLAKRFLDEGKFQASLGHPNVVTVTDILRFDGQVALVMEFIDGITLEDCLEQRGALPVSEAFALFVPILAAVAAAHDRRVLHRDLKPANVLLANTPVGWVPKVADFGIAKFVEEEMGGGSTTAGMIMGSPGYMAPEQVRDSSTVDERADIFSLGAILYEMLTGRRAFADVDGGVSVTSTLDREPPPVDVPDVTPEIAAAIRRALARDREVRFSDCRAFAQGLGLDAHPLLLDLAEHSGYPPTFDSQYTGARPTRPPAEPSTAPPRSSTWLVLPVAAGTLAIGGLVLVLVLAVVVSIALQSRWTARGPDPVPPIAAPAEPAPPDPAPPDPTAAATDGGAIDPAGSEPAGTDPAGAGAEGGGPDGQAPSGDDPGRSGASGTDPATPQPNRPEAAPTDPTPAPPDPTPDPDPQSVAGPAPSDPPAPLPSPPPAPVPDPDAVAVAEPAPPPPVPRIELSGMWKGKAANRPFELKLTRKGDAVSAEAMFVTGTNSNRSMLSGTFDDLTKRLMLQSSDGSIRFDGGLDPSGSKLSGTYRQKKSKVLDWSVSR